MMKRIAFISVVAVISTALMPQAHAWESSKIKAVKMGMKKQDDFTKFTMMVVNKTKKKRFITCKFKVFNKKNLVAKSWTAPTPQPKWQAVFHEMFYLGGEKVTKWRISRCVFVDLS